MKTVLVTGGGGFIGGYVIEELRKKGYEPVVLDTRYRTIPGDPKIALGDIRDETSVTEAIAHADGVIHLAGVLGTQETITNPRPAAETNILGGLNVFEACAQYKIPLVNIAVGNWWMNNTYSLTKNTMERFADMLNKYRGTKITVVRALNAYGPRQSAIAPWGSSKVRKIMPSFACKALSGQDIEVYGDGEQIMDMIYVADVAAILVRALEVTAETGKPVYGIGNGIPTMPSGDLLLPSTLEAGSGRMTTVNEIAGLVIDEVERRGYPRVNLVHLPMRPGENAGSVVLGDPRTLAPLGISSSDFMPLEQGVEKSVGYFEEYLKGGR